MISNFLVYLVETSFCLAVFSLSYWLFFSNLTLFKWNRLYLLVALGLSLIVPLIAFPEVLALFSGDQLTIPYSPRTTMLLQWLDSGETVSTVPHLHKSLDLQQVWPLVLLGIYVLGFIFKLYGTLRSLRQIYRLVYNHKQENNGTYTVINIPNQSTPAFSFARFIFLSPVYYQLSQTERQQILAHEKVHVEEKHTLDLLFFEIANILFWFNPLVKYLKGQLKNVHEYLADFEVSATTKDTQNYGKLLIKLAS